MGRGTEDPKAGQGGCPGERGQHRDEVVGGSEKAGAKNPFPSGARTTTGVRGVQLVTPKGEEVSVV